MKYKTKEAAIDDWLNGNDYGYFKDYRFNGNKFYYKDQLLFLRKDGKHYIKKYERYPQSIQYLFGELLERGLSFGGGLSVDGKPLI